MRARVLTGEQPIRGQEMNEVMCGSGTVPSVWGRWAQGALNPRLAGDPAAHVRLCVGGERVPEPRCAAGARSPWLRETVPGGRVTDEGGARLCGRLHWRQEGHTGSQAAWPPQ